MCGFVTRHTRVLVSAWALGGLDIYGFTVVCIMLNPVHACW